MMTCRVVYTHETSRRFPEKRNGIRLAVAGLTLAMTLLYTGSARAQAIWTSNGVKAGESTTATNLQAVPDGHGGVFLAYVATSDKDVYAQWIDASGAVRWDTGKPVITDIGEQILPSLCVDGSGGIYVAWTENSSSPTAVKIQHLNSDGTRQFDASGLSVATVSGNQFSVKMVSDGSTGAILVWQDERNGNIDLYAQKILSNGVLQWESGGKTVISNTGDQQAHSVIPDGSGGIYVTWEDTRAGESDYNIYAQRLNNVGAKLWTPSGVAISTASSNQRNPVLTLSGIQVVIGWEDYRSGSNYDVYAQAVDASGNIKWIADGKSVCAAGGAQTHVRIAEDGSGGAILTWADQRVGNDIYAQDILSDGTPKWALNGVVVNNLTSYQSTPEIVSDGSSGAIITWLDARAGFTNYDVYGQRLNSSGSPQWNANGLAICTATGNQLNHVLVSDGAGGAISQWQDSRDGQNDIYAQHLADNLSITAPTGGESWNGLQSNLISWTRRTSNTIYQHYTIKASLTSGDNFPLTIEAAVPASTVSKGWTPTSVNSATVKIKVEAYNDQSLKVAEITSGDFLIDSNAPAVFDLVSPSNGSWTNDTTPTLQWNASNDGSGSGLNKYEVWIDGALAVGSIASTTTQVDVPSAKTLSEGSHPWSVKAYDNVGITRTSTSTFTIKVDVTPPGTFNLSSPAINAYSTTSSPTFSWEAASDGTSGSGLNQYQLWINNSLNKSGITGTSTSPASGLSDDTYTWTVKALDNAGNVRTASSRNIVIDTTPPADFNLSSPASGSIVQTFRPTFQWTASSDPTSGFQKYEVYVDGDRKSVV